MQEVVVTSSGARDGFTRTQARVAGILAAAALSAVGSTALATEYNWAVPVGTWNNRPKWNPSGEPQTGDNAIIDYLNGTCDVIGSVGNPVEMFEPASASRQ
jgi:hypothetical protein